MPDDVLPITKLSPPAKALLVLESPIITLPPNGFIDKLLALLSEVSYAWIPVLEFDDPIAPNPIPFVSPLLVAAVFIYQLAS